MVVLIIMFLLAWFCSANYPGTAADIIEIISKIGLVISAVIWILNWTKSEREYREKHKYPEGRQPVTQTRYGEDIDTPWRRKELIKWNAKNLDYLYKGPINETPALRSLRLSLLTPEQLALIPFWKRVAVRSGYYHPGRDCFGGYACIICGKGSDRDQWCSECKERYKKDMMDGWQPKPQDHIKEGYEWVLWRLQQIVAKDRQLRIISEETAKVEMEEVVEVARQEISEMEKCELERRLDVQQRQNQQSELSDIVKRLS